MMPQLLYALPYRFFGPVAVICCAVKPVG